MRISARAHHDAEFLAVSDGRHALRGLHAVHPTPSAFMRRKFSGRCVVQMRDGPAQVADRHFLVHALENIQQHAHRIVARPMHRH